MAVLMRRIPATHQCKHLTVPCLHGRIATAKHKIAFPASTILPQGSGVALVLGPAESVDCITRPLSSFPMVGFILTALVFFLFRFTHDSFYRLESIQVPSL